MRHKLLFTLLVLSLSNIVLAQQIPLGSCGIVYIYDATGCRTKRTYFCNNGGTYPQRPSAKNTAVNTTTEEQLVDILYPNPTTGIFNITFTSPLKNAIVSIFDATGKIARQTRAKGKTNTFNLFGLSSGVYFIKVLDNGKSIEMKVIKQ
jgi:hypothetical protein